MGRKNWILVVEDERDIQEALSELLELEGYQSRHVYDGRQALGVLDQARGDLPSLILLDLMMPEMDGIEFRQHQLRDADFARIPVVVMTADARKEPALLLAGIADYLKKPIDIDDLLAVVARHTGP